MGGGAVFTEMTKDDYTTFDLAMWNWTPPIDPDFVLSVLTCGQFGSWSDSGYCNPKYDELYKAQGAEMDPQKRLEIVYEMQKMVYDDRPYIMLTYGTTIDAWSPKWAGFVQSVQGLFPFLSKESLTQVHQV
jgi:peptide/nickel transport system substrate-binding protein